MDRQATVAALEKFLRQFLRRNERALICLQDQSEGSLASMLAEAITAAGGIPTLSGSDLRWKKLLRLAFDTRATVIVAAPLVVLGLTKLSRATSTPLFVRNIITAGYPCMDWMNDGICRGLDCKTWGIFDPEGIVVGYSCKESGVHIFNTDYTVEATDYFGNILPSGQYGELMLLPRTGDLKPVRTREQGRVVRGKCECGGEEPHILDIYPGNYVDSALADLGARINSAASVLDCRLRRSSRGIEVELVTLHEPKLPWLPTFAKKVVRPWDPERDVPYGITAEWKIPTSEGQSH